MEGALEVVGALPDESPNSVRLAHDDVTDLTRAEVFVGGASHLEILAEEHDLEGGVGAMANFDHLEAEVLPDGVDEHVNEGDRDCHEHHFDAILPGLLVLLLDPIEGLRHDVGHKEVVELEQEAHEGELAEVPLVDGQETLHEGESILRVLLDVVLDIFLDQLLLVLDLKALGELAILLELDLLVHGALEQGPGVPVEELVQEGRVLPHVSALEHLVEFLFLLRFVVFYL